MAGAVMLPPVIILAAVLSSYATLSTGWEFGEIVHRDVQVPYVISDVVNNMPDEWDAKTKQDYQNGLITAFEREVRLERSRKLRPTTDALAERIWAAGQEEFYVDFSLFAYHELIQYMTGKVTGRLYSDLYGELSGEVAEVMSDKLTKEVVGQLSEETVEAVLFHELGTSVGEATYAVAVSEIQNAAPEQQKGPDLSQEVTQLVEGMRQAIQSNPPQLMVARFQHIINRYRYYSSDLTPTQLIDTIKNEIEGIHTFEVLTKVHSPDSMWKDTEELARWIATRVILPDLGPEYTLVKEEPEEEPKKEPEEEPDKPPTEVELEPEDIALPLPFFLEGDAEKLAPSVQLETPELLKHKPHPIVVDSIAYRGHWGPEQDRSLIAIAVFACNDVNTAQKYFFEIRDQFKVDAAIDKNNRSKVGCPVPSDAIQEIPNRISLWLPYCEQEQDRYTSTYEGVFRVHRLYKNTLIIIGGSSALEAADAQLRQFAAEMENNAVKIVDQAIERAKGQGWRE
jgi:hypothetical protein